jgi:hypothetical protein
MKMDAEVGKGRPLGFRLFRWHSQFVWKCKKVKRMGGKVRIEEIVSGNTKKLY